jgi:hypothetical protein
VIKVKADIEPANKGASNDSAHDQREPPTTRLPLWYDVPVRLVELLPEDRTPGDSEFQR